MTNAILAACLLSACIASPVLAANANRPYQNCDRKVDNCGPTGNETTDQLNAQQLGNSAQTGTTATPSTTTPSTTMPATTR